MQKKTIYILEDSEDIQDILTIVFEDQGYEVKVFSSVGQFKKDALKILPDVFLLDVSLPDGNGLKVCSELQSAINTSTIPIVIMTANAQMEKMKEQCNADFFISKPFDINHLGNIVSQLTTVN